MKASLRFCQTRCDALKPTRRRSRRELAHAAVWARPALEFDVLATARLHDASPAQVGLALHQGPHVSTIPGRERPEHLADNVAAAALRLSDDEVSRLDGLG